MTTAASPRPDGGPLRTAIIGGLQAVNVLLPAFHAQPGFQVTTLCARNTAPLAPLAQKFSVATVCAQWEQIANDPSIDVVALAVPASVQGPVALGLAQAGKHLFCEKPLAANYADAERIVMAMAVSGRRAIVHFGFRFVPAFAALEEIIRNGELGRPQMVQVEWHLATRRDASLSWNWKSDASLGGGTFNLMASHVLDYLGWWFGGIREMELLPTTILTSRPDAVSGQPKAVVADDTCQGLLALGQGVPANFSISTALPVGGNHRIRVWFEKGRLELANAATDDTYDGFKLHFTPVKSATEVPPLTARLVAATHAGQPPVTRVSIAQSVVRALAEAIRSGQDQAPTLADGLRVQHWQDVARQKAGHWTGPTQQK